MIAVLFHYPCLFLYFQAFSIKKDKDTIINAGSNHDSWKLQDCLGKSKYLTILDGVSIAILYKTIDNKAFDGKYLVVSNSGFIHIIFLSIRVCDSAKYANSDIILVFGVFSITIILIFLIFFCLVCVSAKYTNSVLSVYFSIVLLSFLFYISGMWQCQCNIFNQKKWKA